MPKAKYTDYRVTRNAEDSDLQDGDFAFIFKSNGDIRCVQLSGDAHEAMEFAKTFQLPNKPENVMVVSYYED